jgi:hypothetical protein
MTSLTSIHSTRSWLVRQSAQSAHPPPAEFDSSFEELGGVVDSDAEYFRRNSGHRVSSLLASSSATPHQEISRPVSPLSDDGGADSVDRPVEPITTYGSVRRKATLVAGDARVQRSREGLVSEYLDGGGGSGSSTQHPQNLLTSSSAHAHADGGVSPITAPSSTDNSPHIGTSSSSSPDDEDDVSGSGSGSSEGHQEPTTAIAPAAAGKGETPVLVDTHLRHAKSVSYTASGGHSRQFSAGSARLLDVRRSTVDPDRGGGAAAETPEASATSAVSGSGSPGSRPSTGATMTKG